MSDPYIYYPGDPDCAHDDVSISTLTSSPPITEWRCNNAQCGRRIRQTVQPATVTMPTVKEEFDPARYPYAKMKLDGDWLYRTDYVHGEDEEIPEEFTATDDIHRAWKQFQWYRALYEVEMNLRYNLKTGTVELIGVDGVPLERPVVMMS